jgi:hypothetical protein
MPIAFLFIIFTFLFTSVFAQTIKGVINPQVVESAAYDVAYATVPYTILKPSMPLSSLPAKKITDKFVLTNRIDTLGVAYVYDSTTVWPRAFTFKPDYDEDGQAVAIQRKDDWIILDWRLFKPKSPAGMKMKWIDVDGKGSPELMFSRDSPEEQILESEISPITGRKYNTHKNWHRATSLCIIDIDALSFAVQTIYTGYEYFYELSEYVSGPENKGPGYVYPDSYYTNRERKNFKMLYDFTIKEGKGLIEIRQVACKETVTRDPSKRYLIKTDLSESPAEQIESEKEQCFPMYQEGTYALKDGQFIKVQ